MRPPPRHRPGRPAPRKAPAPPPGPGAGLRVLFIGNSLTYANDMPWIVQALAKATGQSLDVAVESLGGANLEDHWNHGAAQRRIDEGGWSVVVLQQGPSSLVENRENMRELTRRFAERIAKVGARTAMYMVWPDSKRLAFFDQVRESYALAAEDVGGMLFPAGEAWRAAWRREPHAPLYRRDGFHPSPTGSYTAALSIYGMLYGRPLRGLPARLQLRKGAVVQVPPRLATLLQEAATEANEQFGKS